MAIFTDIAPFAASLPTRGGLIGLDPGTRTIGVAGSDITRMVATPVVTIERGKKTAADLDALQRLFNERAPTGVVLGYPLEMDGTPGSRAQSSRAFARVLDERFRLPLLLWDERLSTRAVERTLIGEADLTRAKRKAVVDRAAAAYILQGVLDALRHTPTNGD